MMDIDHIGYVVKDMDLSISQFTGIYGFRLEDGPIYDPAQHVRLAMVVSENNYRIELIQPIDKTSPSYDFMEKGGGMHHFCYVVEDLDVAATGLKKKGHLVFKRAVEAPLLGGRRVLFLFSKTNNQIVELVEEGK